MGQVGSPTSPPRGWTPHLGFPLVGSGGVHLQLSFGGEVGVHLQLSFEGSWSPPPRPPWGAPRGLGQPLNPPFHLYIEGQGQEERHTIGAPSRLTVSSLLPPNPPARVLGEALQDFFLHLHHHDVVLLDVARRSTSPPPLLAGMRRGRTSSTPYARPSTEVLPERSIGLIDYINNEPKLVGFGILRG